MSTNRPAPSVEEVLRGIHSLYEKAPPEDEALLNHAWCQLRESAERERELRDRLAVLGVERTHLEAERDALKARVAAQVERINDLKAERDEYVEDAIRTELAEAQVAALREGLERVVLRSCEPPIRATAKSALAAARAEGMEEQKS